MTAESKSRRRVLRHLAREVDGLGAEMRQVERKARARIDAVDPTFELSARNLVRYLAMRRHDRRALQRSLAQLGLSSLGRAEEWVAATVELVARALRGLARVPDAVHVGELPAPDMSLGAELLERNTRALLGEPPPGREVRIMVTMPSEAADDYALVRDLLAGGMDVMRINCAHDDEARWKGMIGHLRRAEKTLGRRCRVLMDLSGPKLRTGPVTSGPAVLRVRPQRDTFGAVLAPARVWLTADDDPREPPAPADAVVRVPARWLAGLRASDAVVFDDARGSHRKWKLVDSGDEGAWAEAAKTAYLVPGTLLTRERKGTPASAKVGAIPAKPGSILLREGDRLVVTRSLAAGTEARLDRKGKVLRPASVGCTLPGVFRDARPGERIYFDDGRIGGVIEKAGKDRLQVRVVRARPGGVALRADKGINLPDSALRTRALTDKDRRDLEFIGPRADMVGLSFVDTVADVRALRTALAGLGPRPPAIMLKVETRRGFDNLPAMLLEAMRARSCGVMIARGDLAVECGFERLAEVQEEILWVCEAAHVPVVWATEVLDTLAKRGAPTRAEITDAAMSMRAECVMLNKGPYIREALRSLDDILRRMSSHQTKKRAMLRELRIARGL
ncbi:MAG TPA: pyruvate kinase [Burkholderiales bacterium]|nr:pyruvate kinase [Burkholderiales bacterium]